MVIDLSAENEKLLQSEWGDLNRSSSEALVTESYRQGKLSLGQCSRIFCKTLLETKAFFRSRSVDLPMTTDDVHRDIASLESVLK